MNRLTSVVRGGARRPCARARCSAYAQQPLKIGFGMSLTGPLAGNGKAALISMQIWAEDVNAKGGILGRKVELVYYDDQTNPSTVPSIYNKLLDVDKVDLLVSGYGTNVIAPAMPIVMQRNMAFMGAVRPQRQLEIQLRPLLPDHARGTRAGDRLDARLLRYRDGSRRPSRKRLRWWARTPSIRRWRWKARASRSSGPG